MQKLPKEFYQRDTVQVAKDLLGKVLVHHDEGVIRIGKIVEVEAYVGQQDLASHSSKGITKRTEVMYGPAGFAYIYLIYGMYYCTNVVTEKEGVGSAVLIRALEPVQNTIGRTQGPGLLSRAMNIDKSLNRHDLTGDTFYLADTNDQTNFTIMEKPRIGVHYAKDWTDKLLRFYIKDNAFISKP
ncbi:DNA-3-methyladenine glycosylase [Legionella bononiensis]|uniref:Putative 3-methyladenine DNA glycosylase n=1 Tax=Legionella bononiensis TaxID=2793102 RepID=A0ABS1W879_9GAMM|nr:DNA-3-methyladenine glycosylase [Legionella bononiensis]MBL7479914.1 DNA-3-methyladenine glycosylase [Legionella bononiensis]MBL7525571.1 DNA-3-methyladenine glycosylase [Legionella bononiensis]MBL7561755.1 DNA-3-methyladenine glycosylase [Legionella bononiensis]